MNILIIDRDLTQAKSISRIFNLVDREATCILVEAKEDTFEIPYSATIDVVICDNFIPLNLHDQVLENFKYTIPKTVRVTSTDMQNPDVIGSATTLSHFVVIKPIDQFTASNIIYTYHKIVSLGLTDDFFEKVNSVEINCCQSDIIIKLRDLLKSSDYGLQDVVKIISHDPVLSAKIISVSNTAYFKYSRMTNSLAEAVNRIGINQIDSICTYLLLHLNCNSQSQHDAIERIGDLAFETSRLCCEIGKINGFSVKDLEDIQSCSFLTFIGDIFVSIREFDKAIDSNQFSFIDMKDAIGAYLLMFWGFPEHVIRIILELSNEHFYTDDIELLKKLRIIRFARAVVSRKENRHLFQVDLEKMNIRIC